MKKIKILLVDDHDIVMDGIEAILNESLKTVVCGKATSPALAETLVKKLEPDIMITDISMGTVSGEELTKIISKKYPLVKIIVLTMHEDVNRVGSMLQAGAMGYLLKNVRQDELFRAIEEVMQGNQYIQQSVAASYARASQRKNSSGKQTVLSPREIEIIRLISAEFSTAEISRQLFLSELTVETHRKNMLRKTGAKSVIGLLNYARSHGILD